MSKTTLDKAGTSTEEDPDQIRYVSILTKVRETLKYHFLLLAAHWVYRRRACIWRQPKNQIGRITGITSLIPFLKG